MKKILSLLACLVFCLNTFAQVVTINVSGKDVNGLDVSLDSIVIYNKTRGWIDISNDPTVSYTYSSLSVDVFSVDTDVTVTQNHANGRTFIDIKMGRSEMVNLDVFDITGRKVAVFSSNLKEGNNRFELKLKSVGLHIVKICRAKSSKIVKVVNQTEEEENIVFFVGNRSDVKISSETEREIGYGDNILIQGYAKSFYGKTIKSQIVDTPVTTTNLELVVPFTVYISDCFDKGFSISDSKKVYFANGNLQYKASTKKWRFAEKPWDFVGEANTNISSTYSGWIDLFGWGSGDDPTQHSIDHYYKEFYDWGDYCELPTPEGTTGKWRTLTCDEWDYVMYYRTTSSGVRFARAKVNDVNGIIIVPDNWASSIYLLSCPNPYNSSVDYIVNVISSSTWKSVFEPAGCVFLPAAGSRKGSIVSAPGSYGHYWSSSAADYSSHACLLSFGSSTFGLDGEYRYFGHSVRLVADVE